MGNYHVPFCRAVEGATPSLTLIIVAELLWQQAKASVKAQANPVLKGVNYQVQVKHKESWATDSGDFEGF